MLFPHKVNPLAAMVLTLVSVVVLLRTIVILPVVVLLVLTSQALSLFSSYSVDETCGTSFVASLPSLPLFFYPSLLSRDPRCVSHPEIPAAFHLPQSIFLVPCSTCLQTLPYQEYFHP